MWVTQLSPEAGAHLTLMLWETGTAWIQRIPSPYQHQPRRQSPFLHNRKLPSVQSRPMFFPLNTENSLCSANFELRAKKTHDHFNITLKPPQQKKINILNLFWHLKMDDREKMSAVTNAYLTPARYPLPS